MPFIVFIILGAIGGYLAVWLGASFGTTPVLAVLVILAAIICVLLVVTGKGRK